MTSCDQDLSENKNILQRRDETLRAREFEACHHLSFSTVRQKAESVRSDCRDKISIAVNDTCVLPDT
eukprot:2347028-Pleurochrysis_carterae.AAC.1